MLRSVERLRKSAGARGFDFFSGINHFMAPDRQRSGAFSMPIIRMVGACFCAGSKIFANIFSENLTFRGWNVGIVCFRRISNWYILCRNAYLHSYSAYSEHNALCRRRIQKIRTHLLWRISSDFSILVWVTELEPADSTTTKGEKSNINTMHCILYTTSEAGNARAPARVRSSDIILKGC